MPACLPVLCFLLSLATLLIHLTHTLSLQHCQFLFVTWLPPISAAHDTDRTVVLLSFDRASREKDSKHSETLVLEKSSARSNGPLLQTFAELGSDHRVHPRYEVTNDGICSVLLPLFFFNILTYVLDRLYLAAYTHTPTADTPFPYPQTQVSPRKRSQRTVDATSASATSNRQPPYYFTVDDILLYNAFHHDFGPLHIGHLYRFAIHFHDILGAKENKDRPIVFWSAADPRSTFHPPFRSVPFAVLGD